MPSLASRTADNKPPSPLPIMTTSYESGELLIITGFKKGY